jgi:phage tail-like protein
VQDDAGDINPSNRGSEAGYVAPMATSRTDPHPRSHFRVEIDGLVTTAFTDVTPPGGSAAVIEYREGSDVLGSSRPMRGNVTLDKLTLRRGYDGQSELYLWWSLVRQGNPAARRNMSIVLIDEQGNEVTRWNVLGAFPSSHRFERLEAMSSLPVIEVVEIVYANYEML